MRCRFHRNAGARGEAEWVCLVPDQSRIWCYARVFLVRDVVFEIAGLDGWAIGELAGHLGALPNIRGRELPPEIACSPLQFTTEGWLPLWYHKRKGFFSGERKVERTSELLLGPGLAVIR